MADNKKYNQYNQLSNDEDAGGASGQAGAVEFREFIGTGVPERDDLLSGEQKRILLQQHENQHQNKVYAQKAKQDQLKAVKDGKLSLSAFRGENQAASGYKPNPVLADKAQFSGADNEVTPIPLDNKSEANPELRYTHQLQNQPKNAPQFNPKPAGPY